MALIVSISRDILLSVSPGDMSIFLNIRPESDQNSRIHQQNAAVSGEFRMFIKITRGNNGERLAGDFKKCKSGNAFFSVPLGDKVGGG